MPIAAISLVDQNREWFKSCVGVPAREGARANSFCGYTILESETLIIPDAAADERFTDNPQVVEDGIRFYAGHPLRTPDGHRIGAFCIKDRRPRRLRPDQVESLRALAAIAETELYPAEVLELKRELDTRSQSLGRADISTKWMLPMMDGTEVLERMRADPALQDVPVIALTAHAMRGDREKYLALGFDDYVTKPVVDEADLFEPIERLLAARSQRAPSG